MKNVEIYENVLKDIDMHRIYKATRFWLSISSYEVHYSSEQLVDFLFKLAFGWVVLVHNLARLIDQSDVWDAFEIPLRKFIFALPVVLDGVPALFFNSFVDGCHILVKRNADDSDLASPRILILCEHFLVVGHGTLAGWTPGCPKVDQDDLAVVLDIGTLRLQCLEASDDWHLRSYF